MIYEVMRHCHNFFSSGKGRFGKWQIKDGKLELPFAVGQYFLIEGSLFNDGVYIYGNDYTLVDEEFEGCITGLKPPKAFIALCVEIGEWREKYAGVDSTNLSPYQSENFDGYSYTKSGNADGVAVDWTDVFKARLNEWRRI